MLLKTSIIITINRKLPKLLLSMFIFAWVWNSSCGMALATETSARQESALQATSRQAAYKPASRWHQYYQPMEGEAVYAFVEDAFIEAKRLYGEPLVPVHEIHIRQSIKRLQPGSLAWADIIDWQQFAKTLSAKQSESPYKRIWLSFSPKMHEKLKNLVETAEKLNHEDKIRIIKNLNLLLSMEGFYNKQGFATVKVPREVMRLGGFGFFARKPANPTRFNRALLELLFPEALMPMPPRKHVNEGLQLCECADPAAGRFVIYVSTPFERPESRLEIAHEAAHLLNPYLYDWYVEGLGNVFARDLINNSSPDPTLSKKYWQPWEQLFENGRDSNPYAIAYFMMSDMRKAIGEKGLQNFLYFAAWEGDKHERRHIDINAWLSSLPQEEREKALEIIRQYAPKLNKHKGKINAFMLPEGME